MGIFKYRAGPRIHIKDSVILKIKHKDRIVRGGKDFLETFQAFFQGLFRQLTLRMSRMMPQ